MFKNQRLEMAIIYCLVFFSGFANLATEIIGPRLVASLFGTTTVIWAIIISVTLIGISVGYFLGGRVPAKRVAQALPAALILNAIWLLGLSWFVWLIPAEVGAAGYASILVISVAAFFLPAVLFSMTSPLVIAWLAAHRPADTIARQVGNIYALGTLGSVLGALAAAFILIPWVGLTGSLRIFAAAAVVFALPFLATQIRPAATAVLAALMLVGILLFPQPGFHPEEDFSAVLLEQTDGYYQTIRVYTDNSTYMRMDLGPTAHARMNLETHEPMHGYAVEMVRVAGDVQGKKVLIIGGAGHTQSRSLEKRGAIVTEVEIDPFVVDLSDQYFGKIQGQIVVQDGRPYLEQLQGQQYDLILVDAFDSIGAVPPQLTTQEFFQTVARTLTPQGRMIFNFIGVPAGPKSNAFRALTTTMYSAFPVVAASRLEGDHLVNVVLVAARQPLSDPAYQAAPADGVVLTDDLNPIEIFAEQARGN